MLKKRPKVIDSSSATKKSKGEDSSGSKNFNYDPVHFIRSHSKNNDPADIQTQIWEVRPCLVSHQCVYSNKEN